MINLSLSDLKMALDHYDTELAHIEHSMTERASYQGKAGGYPDELDESQLRIYREMRVERGLIHAEFARLARQLGLNLRLELESQLRGPHATVLGGAIPDGQGLD